jgi:hypothetical protein
MSEITTNPVPVKEETAKKGETPGGFGEVLV